MRTRFLHALDSERLPAIAGLISLALGLFFTLVWAPHPWGWQGIDAYHELARALARGESFPTTDVPWGYAYYAAAFYKLFGERQWAPLVVQVIANAFVPLLLYRLVRPLSGQRTAALASLIVGVFSFNTIYASTQSSDTICTVLFLAGLLCFASGVRHARLAAFVAAGALFGLVPQFRPNMVLFPSVMIVVYLLLKPRTAAKLAQVAVFAAVVTLMQLPWIAHNYRLTGMLLPTSTHGGVQLWYGTLQVGPYLESRAHNPRFYFESAAFDYTSLSTRPIHITANHRPCFDAPVATEIVYWTDRDPQRRRMPPHAGWSEAAGVTFDLPPQPNHTALYYYFEQAVPSAGIASPLTFAYPIEGAANPFVLFISDDHLGDLDRHGDVLDVFDLVRLLRHIAWQDRVANSEALDLNQDGRLDAADIEQIIQLQVPELAANAAGKPGARVTTGPAAVELHLPDGSWISVPREFSGKQTDLGISLDGEMAPALISRHRTMTSVQFPPRRLRPGECQPAVDATVNAPFNWREPHMMSRYMALAFDNIERDPGAFAMASLYRMVRLFIVRGTNDVATSQQFNGSAFVYAAGTVLSIAYLVVFVAGVLAAFRRRSALLLFLVPIVYVPVTICFVLTNMRYTVTVQPLMFAFVALAIVAALESRRGGTSESAT